MRISFVTLFPDLIEAVLGHGIVARARERGLIDFHCVNPRDFTSHPRRKVDDRPYGGGSGMILMAEPIYRAVKDALGKGGRKGVSRVVYLSPQGKRFDQPAARRLSRERHLVLVCGRYEGVDARLSELFDEELSIGDYVLAGGELPALVVAETVVRLAEGVLKKREATEEESFEGNSLDYPQYTRPRVWRRRRVPEVLFSGDHGAIARFRREQARRVTARKRPDLMAANEQSTRRVKHGGRTGA